MLNFTEISVKLADTVQLVATVLPENAYDKRVIWTTSDSDILVVENGIITPKKTGEATVTVTTIDGKYSATCTVVVFKCVYGDTNGDNTINAVDAVLLAQKLAGWDVDLDISAADCNGDGVVNAVDAVLLAQYLAGWDVVLG